MKSALAMKHRRLAAVLFLTCSSAAAQVWTKQTPLPTGVDLAHVQMVSPSEAWAIGDDGVLIHTADGGDTWELTQLASNSMDAVFFVDAQHGWASGNGLFHTVDGGDTWVKDNEWGSIYFLHFIDTQRGWACGNGGVTYRTSNGGLTWSFSPVGDITTLRSIFFHDDALVGWTVNIDGDIYKSTDGGQSWSLHFASGGSNLNTITFFDALEGWAIGGNTFLHTVDGGENWQPVSVPGNTWVYRAFFTDRLHGWGVGEGNGGVRTTDGGQTWQGMGIGGGPRLWGISFADTSTGMLVGETGVLERSLDGGQTWSSLQSGGTGFTRGLDAADPMHAWAAHDGGEVLVTDDGGAHWERVKLPGLNQFSRISDVDFVDASTGWAVGVFSTFGADDGVIYKSIDGGRHWIPQFQQGGTSLDKIDAVNEQTAFAVGQVISTKPLVLRTTNGGVSWTDVSPQAFPGDVDFVDENVGWVVGGLIHKTTNGGASWVTQLEPDYFLHAVSFSDELNGWAVGSFETVLRTTDGGATWVPQEVGGPQNFTATDVMALDEQTAWLVGSHGFVARTTDGGQSWVRETVGPGPPGSYTSVFFVDEEYGWVGGSNVFPSDGIHRRQPECPTPTTYCTGKVASHGFVPKVSWAGSNTFGENDLVLRCFLGVAGKPGIYLAAADAAALPFQGGTLCLAPPLARSLPFVFDGSGRTFQPIEILPEDIGLTRRFQFWFRDSGDPAGFGSGLSDAGEVTFCP